MQIFQEHSSTFYLLSLLALCSLLLAVSLKAFAVFIALRKFTVKPLGPSSVSLEVTGSSFLPASMINRVVLVSACSTLFAWGVITWTIFDRFHRSELVRLEKVQINSKDDSRNFKASIVENPGSSKLISFSLTACDPLENDVVAGVTLCKFYYVVDSHLHCFDWNAKHAGYTVWRDGNNEPILTSDTGPPAASCEATPTHSSAETGPETQARARR